MQVAATSFPQGSQVRVQILGKEESNEAVARNCLNKHICVVSMSGGAGHLYLRPGLGNSVLHSLRNICSSFISLGEAVVKIWQKYSRLVCTYVLKFGGFYLSEGKNRSNHTFRKRPALGQNNSRLETLLFTFLCIVQCSSASHKTIYLVGWQRRGSYSHVLGSIWGLQSGLGAAVIDPCY